MSAASRPARTMYLHTLDGQPASYAVDPAGFPHIYFVGGRHRARLVDSLRHLRMEQRWARDAEPEGSEWKDAGRYGYVLVRVSP